MRAMHEMIATACIEAPHDEVWKHLARLDQVHLWTDVIHHSYMTTACATGVGAERACELPRGKGLRERVVAWDEGRSFTYESSDAPMMALARNTWTVEAIGARTLVTSRAELCFRGGLAGYVLGWLLVPLLRRLLPNPLAKFKFWVENGRPYEGRTSSLPVPAPVC